MMRFFASLTFLLFSTALAMGQYASPVDFPIVLAGNVGEIRATHFHSGIDIKSPVGIGAPIRSIANGYVERVVVSPVGYGKGVYIRHLDGSVSVYGHLDKFEKSIAAWVKAQQLAKKSFRVDLYPPSTMFAVKQGDLIGYLGNSGSSGGPHLHLEIRNSAGEPLNIQARNFFTVTDNVAPKLYKVVVMECDTVNGAPIFSATSSVEFKDGVPVNGKVLTATRPFYIAYDLVDFASTSNTLGIYSLFQSVDKATNFGFVIDKTSYTNGKYVNAMVERGVAAKGRSWVLRAYVSPNNGLKIYRDVKGRGILSAPLDGQPIDIETTLTDNNGNSSNIAFTVVKGKERAAPIVDGQKVSWDKDFRLETSDFRLFIPKGALYESTLINTSGDINSVTIGAKNIVLHKNFTLALKSNLDLGLQSKAIIVNSGGKSMGGVYKDGFVEATIGNFGTFSVSYDNTPPVIVYNGIKGGFLSFKISDNLSGIKSYKLTIDGQWAIGDYDAKTGTIGYDLDYGVQSSSHNVELTVTDGKANSTTVKKVEQW